MVRKLQLEIRSENPTHDIAASIATVYGMYAEGETDGSLDAEDGTTIVWDTVEAQ
jgi:hypothetical protein